MTIAELTKLLKGVKVKDMRENLLEMEMEVYYDGGEAADLVRDALLGTRTIKSLPRTRKGIIREIASWLDIERQDDEETFDDLNRWGFVQADDEK
jgi:hypothetical protein